jgi:hypothetical protein
MTRYLFTTDGLMVPLNIGEYISIIISLVTEAFGSIIWYI